MSSWAISKKNFPVIARTRLSQGITSSGLKIGLGWLGVKPLGLLLGLLASQVAGSGSILIRLLKEKPRFFGSISLSGIMHAAIRFSRFPLLQSWSRLLLGLGVQLPALFMAALYGDKVAGLFGLAHNMINLPMNLLGASVSQVYYAEIARYGKSRPDKIRKLSISIMKKMFLVGIIPMGAIMIAGPWMFSLIFGPAWYDAGVYARLLAIIILTRSVASPVANCFDVLEMQGTQLFLNIVRVVLIVIIFLICKYAAFYSYTAVKTYSITIALYFV
ncbi:MAG: lipopolysaccharide biosynthesis protein, partial [Desulfobaccales bacterium]